MGIKNQRAQLEPFIAFFNFDLRKLGSLAIRSRFIEGYENDVSNYKEKDHLEFLDLVRAMLHDESWQPDERCLYATSHFETLKFEMQCTVTIPRGEKLKKGPKGIRVSGNAGVLNSGSFSPIEFDGFEYLVQNSEIENGFEGYSSPALLKDGYIFAPANLDLRLTSDALKSKFSYRATLEKKDIFRVRASKDLRGRFQCEIQYSFILTRMYLNFLSLLKDQHVQQIFGRCEAKKPFSSSKCDKWFLRKIIREDQFCSKACANRNRQQRRRMAN